MTTLIVGLALLAFGSGAVRGFAVVHCIGILTSMFSAVFFSRGLVNLGMAARRSSRACPSARSGNRDADTAVAKTQLKGGRPWNSSVSKKTSLS